MIGPRGRVLATAIVLVTAIAACGSGAKILSRAEPVTLERGLVNLAPDFRLPKTNPTDSIVIAATKDDGILAIGSQPDRGQGSTWGYRYDEARHELTTIARPPFSPAAAGIAGVWTGKALIVLGVLCQDRSRPDRIEQDMPIECYPGSMVATSYDPDADTWTDVPLPIDPGLPTGNAGFVAGSVGWSGDEAYFSIGPVLQAFNPATSTWRKIPDPPPGPVQARVCLTDRGLVASWTKPIDFGPEMVRPYIDQAISFAFLDNNATTWQPVETPPVAVRPNEANMFNAVCGPTDFILTNRWLDSVWLYDLPTAQWRALPNPPIEMEHIYPSGAMIPVILTCTAWTGHDYLLNTIGHPDSHALGLDPRTDTWRKIQPAPQPPRPSPCSDPHWFSWRDGTVFGGVEYLWSWTPPDFDGVLPPFPTPQTSPPVPVPNQ